MANYQSPKVVSLLAGEDLTGDFAEALTINGSGQVVKTRTATDRIIGALAEDPSVSTTGVTVSVALVGGGGVLKMKAGGSIVSGALIVPGATGGRVAGAADVASLASEQTAIGVALEGASDGDIFSVLAQPIAADRPVSKNVSMTAGEDLSGDVAESLKVNGSGQVVKTTGATDVIVGVLAEEPADSAVGTSVQVTPIGAGGIIGMKAGGAITAGQLIVPDATTNGTVAGVANIGSLADDQMAVGIALSAASSGDIVSVLAQTVTGPHSA